MSGEALLALAERCEAATGPSRELDALIYCAFNEGFEAVREHAFWMVAMGPMRHGMPLYTGSLDAAMSLVPEGWQADLSTGAARLSDALVAHIHPGLAATPALALTAAALRARAASEQAS